MSKMALIEAFLDRWMEEGLEVPFSNHETQSDKVPNFGLTDYFPELFDSKNNMDERSEKEDMINEYDFIDTSAVMSPMSNPNSPDCQVNKVAESESSKPEPEAIIEDIFDTLMNDTEAGMNPNDTNLSIKIDTFLQDTNLLVPDNDSLKVVQEVDEDFVSKKGKTLNAESVISSHAIISQANVINSKTENLVAISIDNEVLAYIQTPIPSPRNPDPKSSIEDDENDPDWRPTIHSAGPSSKRKRKLSDDSDFGERSESKKTQNKEAARRYRDKKKQEGIEIEKKRGKLEEINKKFQAEFEEKLQKRKILLELWKDLEKTKTNPNFSITFPSWMAK